MASDETIYADEVLAELREIVAEYGPDTTRQCNYAEYEYGEDSPYPEIPVKPHCIVGVFLHRHGTSLEDLASMEGCTIGEFSEEAMLGYTGLRIEPMAHRVLATVQYVQDDGQTWGTAVEKAAEDLPTWEA